MKEIILELEGLNCANCAAKIEKLTKDIDGVDDVSLDFISKKLKVKVESQEKTKNIIDEIKTIVKRLEPDVIVVERDEHDYSHSQGHSHDHGYVKKEDIMKIIFSGILFILPWLLKLEGTPKFIVYLFAYIVVGLEIIIRAFKNLMAGQPLMNIFNDSSYLRAFIIGEYPEGVAVMLFYQIGNYSKDWQSITQESLFHLF